MIRNTLLEYSFKPFPSANDGFGIGVELWRESLAGHSPEELKPSLIVWPLQFGYFCHSNSITGEPIVHYNQILEHLLDPKVQANILTDTKMNLTKLGITEEEAQSRGFDPISLTRQIITYVSELEGAKTPLRFIPALNETKLTLLKQASAPV